MTLKKKTNRKITVPFSTVQVPIKTSPVLASKQNVSCSLSAMLYRLMLNQKGFSREHKVIPGILLPALMAGAFLLPALSPEDGIPVVHAGSCPAAPHCNESSTDVFLLRLLLTLPLLLFSPACLQLRCSSFLNMSSTNAPLFPPQFMSTLF